MKIKPIFLFTAFFITSFYCLSQNLPIGQWQDYLSYQQGITVSQGRGVIYCCTPSGIFSYNLSDNSLQRFNKVTGLSDINCTVARYNLSTGTLVVGYSDGNIDLLSGNQVINIPDLKNNTSQGSKTINNIYFRSDTAYVSCGQGILVLDLSRSIILATYEMGPNGAALNTYSTTIFNDTLFAATSMGIYKISTNDPNLSDYQDWKMVANPLPSGAYNCIVTCGTKMYASFAKHFVNYAYLQDSIYVYNSGKWSLFYSGDNVYSLETSIVNNTPYLVYSGAYNANALDTSGHIMLHIYNYGFSINVNPNDAILDNNMNLWIADFNYGLVKAFSNYVPGQSYFPPGPYSNTMFAIAVQGTNIYSVPGGFGTATNPLGVSNIGVSEYANGSWHRLIDNAQPDTLLDLCCIAIDPQNPLHAFAGSFSDGLVEYNNESISHVYSGASNSTLQNDEDAHYYSVRVGGAAFDTMGNLWVTNSNVQSNEYLSVRKANGTWQAFNFSGIPNLPNDGNVTTVIVTKTGAKWILFPGSGILAYQDNGTFAQPNTSNSVFITNTPGNGNLPSLNVFCMTEDLNGAIWIGNDAQVVVFYSPDEVFNGAGGWDAQNVYVQQTGYTQYLMQDQSVSCIAVDGANRKWIGTVGGGVFLMSADGTQQILNFTSSNSPLLSDNILSIAINQTSGDVFFGTDKGLISYRGTATEGNSAFSNVYVYPDPIPHGYAGPIVIKNLVTNSDIKITTVNGEVVYHTTALGGQAIWYGTNFNGQRVQTGVYLVFCTSPDGTQSLVTKLLFVN